MHLVPNSNPKYMLLIRREVYIFTIQGHCGYVKGQTMLLSTHNCILVKNKS